MKVHEESSLPLPMVCAHSFRDEASKQLGGACLEEIPSEYGHWKDKTEKAVRTMPAMLYGAWPNPKRMGKFPQPNALHRPPRRTS